MFRKIIATILAGWLLGLAAFLWLLPSKPAAAPLKIRTYNMVLINDMAKLTWKGTRLTNNGFCTTVWMGNVADTVVCTPHIITEATEAAVEDPPAETPKPANLRQAAR